jgi:hypothetical protein
MLVGTDGDNFTGFADFLADQQKKSALNQTLVEGAPSFLS